MGGEVDPKNYIVMCEKIGYEPEALCNFALAHGPTVAQPRPRQRQLASASERCQNVGLDNVLLHRKHCSPFRLATLALVNIHHRFLSFHTALS